MAAEVETMFYTSNEANGRFVPWHGLGIPVLEAPTSEKAIELAGLDWEVIPSKVINTFNGKEVPNWVCNTRSTDGAALGMVRGRYQIVQNKEAFDFTDSLIGENVRYETAGSLRNGRIIWLLANMPTQKILDDDVAPFICFTNSHDGSGAIKVCMTPTRVVCNNTLNFALEKADRIWSARHVGDINAKLLEAQSTLGLAQTYMNELNKEADQLATYHISDEEIKRLTERMFSFKEGDSDRKKKNVEAIKENFYICLAAPDLANYKNTGWGVVNAMADLIDHVEPQRVTDNYRENNWRHIINGHPDLDKCYEIVNEMMTA